MLTDKIGIKLFADPATFPKGAAFIEVFHTWIQAKVLPELMIDVVDYAHVVGGTEVYFCGHESDYVVDTAGGRPGLLHRRKRAPQPAEGSVLDDALARLFHAADRLEKEPPLAGLTWKRDELWLGAFDRLHAPNDPATYEKFAQEARPSVERVTGRHATMARASLDPRELLGATIRLA